MSSSRANAGIIVAICLIIAFSSVLGAAQTPPADPPTPATILSQIDLSSLPAPLTLDTPVLATMPAEDDAAFTFTFAGTEMPVFLGVARLRGSANLAIVVLDAENTPLFQASMLTAETLIAGLTMPVMPEGDGYTILVFNSVQEGSSTIEPTDFQLQITRAE